MFQSDTSKLVEFSFIKSVKMITCEDQDGFYLCPKVMPIGLTKNSYQILAIGVSLEKDQHDEIKEKGFEIIETSELVKPEEEKRRMISYILMK